MRKPLRLANIMG